MVRIAVRARSRAVLGIRAYLIIRWALDHNALIVPVPRKVAV